MSDLLAASRSVRLDRAIHALLAQTPEIQAAAVVFFDTLPMTSSLPPSMDEDRVAATGTVFLVSADDEAVLVAVAAKGATAGMIEYEVRRTAATVRPMGGS